MVTNKKQPPSYTRYETSELTLLESCNAAVTGRATSITKGINYQYHF